MNQDIIKALLDWNPWIERSFPKELRGHDRDYQILAYLDLPEIKILEGARRVGKSTLLYQVVEKTLEKNPGVLYINFEDELLKRYSLADIVHAFQERADVQYLFVDEIQLCTEWASFIRKAYDRREMKQIWITGSNSSLIKKEYATLLTGRNFAIDIYPLSFKEYLNFHHCPMTGLPISTPLEINIKKHFDAYLTWGGFPAVALRNTLQKELLINYFDDFIYKDIAARYDVNLIKLKELGLFLMTNTTKMFSYRNIGHVLRLHPNTVTDYIRYFKEIFLFKELYKFDFSLKTQLSHDKKIYVMDTGLAAAISFRFSSDRGRMLENLVFIELIRRKKEIYFYKQKKECDFLVKQDLEVVQAIQVTVSLNEPNTKQREFAGLLEALDMAQLREGLILTDNEEGQEIVILNESTYTITIMPVWKWLLVKHPDFQPATHSSQ